LGVYFVAAIGLYAGTLLCWTRAAMTMNFNAFQRCRP
jgi:hypothetical protein